MRGLHAYSIVGAVLFVSVYCCFYGAQACLKEEREALLQLKDSINKHSNATYYVLEDWVGEDCCQWPAIICFSSSSRVIEIFLNSARDSSLGVWYPNATLFAQFKELESLDLSDNQIGGWVVLEGLCGLKNLLSLNLGDNKFEALPPCLLSNLSALEVLFLYGNYLKGDLPGLLKQCEKSRSRFFPFRLSDVEQTEVF
ncbi:receptor-like protein 9a [Tasmannia lanceolata]|uniref:receptor-like protein 9a n=1 Tax=Tasmannia lanceolata TaxID=3420 RepID=UPI004063C02B